MKTPNVFVKQLTSCVAVVIARPVFFLVIAALATIWAGFYAVEHFKVNSSRDALIGSSAPFLRDYEAFQDAFPIYKRSIVIVIEAENGQKAAAAARSLHAELIKRPDLFTSIFAPAAEPFFRENGLLYLDTADLEKVVDELARSQAALSALANDPSLRGLFDLILMALEASEHGERLPASFVQLMDQLADTGQSVLSGGGESPGWGRLFGGGQLGPTLQVITLQATEDLSSVLSGRAAVAAIRAITEELELTPENGITVRLTGSIPLAYEEMREVGESLGLAGVLSLVLLVLILGFGVRSARIIFAIFVTLFVGLIWTLGWAMYAVGEFNMISATFAVLFLGLGVDFAIHICLRYQQAVEQGEPNDKALKVAAESVGGAVMLNAITAAIGFLSFIPTGYKGVADLGLIAGGGMVLAVIASLTVLPAILAITRSPTGRGAGKSYAKATGGLFRAVEGNANVVSVIALVLAVIAGLIATQARFDFSTLALKDPNSESLIALRRLHEEGIATDYAVYVVAETMDEVDQVAQKLLNLETIKSVETPATYVPDDQDYKLALIDEAGFLLLPALQGASQNGSLSEEDRRRVVDDLEQKLRSLESNETDDGDLRQAAVKLADVLAGLMSADDSAGLLKELEQQLTTNVTQPLEFLTKALQAGPLEFADLPEAVKRRVLAEDGRVRIVGVPAEDMTESAAMRRLVDDVNEVFPTATGRPVLEAGFGQVVVEAFKKAIAIAIVVIVLILLVTVRDMADTALILLPLVMAACFTAATGVIVGIPFNLANIIVLPLIVGLGVANGIHILLRYREDDSMDELLKSSTPRAVVLSTLTTIGAFGALSVSAHDGIQSMGLLLTIAMGYLLICTVIVLPALLFWRAQLNAGAVAKQQRRS